MTVRGLHGFSCFKRVIDSPLPKQPHALRELPLTEMEAVSELVDIDRVYEALFTPIQIPRVVGSDGHRQVREVCNGDDVHVHVMKVPLCGPRAPHACL
jgi:hypothetical protein